MINPQPKKQLEAIKTKTITLHDGQVCIIDAKHLEWLSDFKWRAVKNFKSYYAKTSVFANGKYRDVSMHRMISKTPTGMICHHRNRNSLDNRISNLINMSKKAHQMLHQNETLSIKFSSPGSEA